MSIYTSKKPEISGIYENKNQYNKYFKSYYHETNIGFWSYDEGIPVFTPFDKEVFLCSKK